LAVDECKREEKMPEEELVSSRIPNSEPRDVSGIREKVSVSCG
jgi:hypothetical protein